MECAVAKNLGFPHCQEVSVTRSMGIQYLPRYAASEDCQPECECDVSDAKRQPANDFLGCPARVDSELALYNMVGECPARVHSELALYNMEESVPRASIRS
ncbi:hypothetical protein ElyMa_002832300 [Elysia marginata]|uniref:VWF/SSPO/Zonadhesin-like cysteine-rich domain-containing protein n=1 Tax=Elysia marginata TaxID=1093978 RepID=A0AAV4HWM9_9GAST|nr:hypothetical protein ElyMa_002832300 [Elysia marginata]